MMVGELIASTCASPACRRRWSQALPPPRPAMLVSFTGTSSRRCLVNTSMSARAGRSCPPPGGVPATSSISRIGRHARPPFPLFMRLLLAHAEAAQHLGPERDFVGVELVEIFGAAFVRRHYVVAQV